MTFSLRVRFSTERGPILLKIPCFYFFEASFFAFFASNQKLAQPLEPSLFAKHFSLETGPLSVPNRTPLGAKKKLSLTAARDTAVDFP